MKLLAITLVALCLVQGNVAQFGRLRNFVSGVTGSVKNAVHAVEHAAEDAVASVSGRISGKASVTVSANATDIIANATDLSANANDLSVNVTDLSANVTDISANVTDLSAGATNLDPSESVGGIGGLFSGAANALKKATSGAIGAVSGAASGVLGAAESAASGIRSKLSGGAQAIIDSATADVSVEELTAAAKKLSPTELLETVEGARAEVEARITAVTTTLKETVANVPAKAEAAVNATTKSWNAPVEAILAKAKEAGADVKECAIDGVLQLGKTTATSAVKCVTDKVNEAVTLTKNVVNVPIRAATIATNGVTGYRKCSSHTISLVKRACQVAVLAPATVKSALLVKDAVQYTTQATTLVSTIQTQLTTCVGGVAAKKTIEAGALAGKIVACVGKKLIA